jgi:DNA-binding GntR family transcriptional regulator
MKAGWRPETLTAAVATHIKNTILQGQFPPGSRLPEVALADELETSRGTVREALRMLAGSGFVQIVPRRGAIVTQLSVRATWEISSLRALLEPYAARLALEASGADTAMLLEVKEAFETLRGAMETQDPLLIADADMAFHRAVFARCGHQMLLSQLDTLQALSSRIALAGSMAHRSVLTVEPHAPMMRAVELRDPELLEKAVRTHVIESGEQLMSHLAALETGLASRTPAAGFELGRWPTGSGASDRDAADRGCGSSRGTRP